MEEEKKNILISQTWSHQPHDTYHHHGNGEVGPELVVAPGAGRSVGVLIDASLVYQLRPFLVGVVRVLGHPERSFEGLLQLLVPLGVGDKHQLTCKDGDGINLRVLGLSPRSLSASRAARTIAMNLSSVVREEAFSVELHQPADRRLTESHDFYRCSVAAQPVTENTFSHDFKYAIVTFFFFFTNIPILSNS